MSTFVMNIKTVADLRFALKNIPSQTPIVSVKDMFDDRADGELFVELTWAGKPENAHFIRIWPGGVKDE